LQFEHRPFINEKPEEQAVHCSVVLEHVEHPVIDEQRTQLEPESIDADSH